MIEPMACRMKRRSVHAAHTAAAPAAASRSMSGAAAAAAVEPMAAMGLLRPRFSALLSGPGRLAGRLGRPTRGAQVEARSPAPASFRAHKFINPRSDRAPMA